MALTGVKFRAYPTAEQKLVLSQWMGCARFVWNAKCEENAYFYRFKQKFCSLDTKVPLDQSYSQFKSDELSPWLSECPSQILRNTMCTWRETMSAFLKGECGAPKKKRKEDGGSIWLTSELFRFERGPDGKSRLFIGSKTNNIGYLSFNEHRPFAEPKSLRIRQSQGTYSISFCYEESAYNVIQLSKEAQLRNLSHLSQPELEQITVGVDRGVAIPVHTGNEHYDFSPEQKHHKRRTSISIKVLQKKLSRQQKGSNQRAKTKKKLGRKHQKLANIRTDFAHQTSHKIVSSAQVIIFEDLKTKNMTKAPEAKTDESGRFVKNGATAKAGLNQAILDKGWGQIENFCSYKASRAGKAVFKVSASYTSQECADCGHTHPNNRQSQSEFKCEHCGHTDNADKNAALVIKKRAIKLILDSGTELSARGVLVPGTQRARSLGKTGRAKTRPAMSDEASKMMGLGLVA